MKALSVRQPWAWLIVNGYKDIENRSWNTKFRGEVLIHASSRAVSPDDYLNAMNIARQVGIELPSRADLQRGGIVGYATISGTCESSSSPWFFGPVGFQLKDGQPLSFCPMRGRLSFFETGCWIEDGELRGELEPDMEEEHP